MSDRINAPSQVSIGNALAQSEYTSDTGYLAAPLIQDFASFAIQPTGEQQNLDFLNEPYNPQWPESKKNRWEEYNFGEVATTPAGAAQRTLAEMEAERAAAAQARDPKRQAEVANAQADFAAKQREAQMPYLVELQYQDVLSQLASGKRMVEQNGQQVAQDLTFMERQQLVAQANGLASTIAQMQPNTGKSAAALGPAAKGVGTVNPYGDYLPGFITGGPNYEAQANSLRRGSDARLAIARQQLEALGTPLPKYEGAPPPPTPAEMVVNQYGLKAEDGSPVLFRGSPVIQSYKGGKQVYERLGPDGGFIELTEQEAAELTGGQ